MWRFFLMKYDYLESLECAKHGIELWDWIPTTEERYQASNLGVIKSVDRYVNAKMGSQKLVKGQIIKPGTIKTGHLHISICMKPAPQKTYKVSQLVLMTFYRMPFPKEYALHTINPDPTDNRLNNLRWGSRFDNTVDEVKHNGIHHSSKLDIEIVKHIAEALQSKAFLNKEINQKDIAEMFGVSQGMVSGILHKKRQTAALTHLGLCKEEDLYRVKNNIIRRNAKTKSFIEKWTK